MSKDKQHPKKKKERVVYIDDGSTVADMSGVKGNSFRRAPQPSYGKQKRQPATRAGSIWQTYKEAVRAMIGPMLTVLGGMTVIFFLIWVILGFFA